jgi:hypothetical protein
MNGLTVYGAIVGSLSFPLALAAFGWQVYSWRRDRSTRVEVKLSNAFVGLPTGPEQAVVITAINHSRHPIRVNSAGLELQDGSGNWSIKPYAPNGAGIPGVIQPNDSADSWWFLGEVAHVGLDLYKPTHRSCRCCERKAVPFQVCPCPVVEPTAPARTAGPDRVSDEDVVEAGRREHLRLPNGRDGDADRTQRVPL